MAILGHQQNTLVSWRTSSHLWKQSKGVGINVNVTVVDVVSQQPLSK